MNALLSKTIVYLAIMAILIVAFQTETLLGILVLSGTIGWYWKKHKIGNPTKRLDDPITPPPGAEPQSSPTQETLHIQESERLTARQAAALLAASNNFHIYNGQARSKNKNRHNTFNARTLSSLSNQKLLSDNGDHTYHLTFMGYRTLRQLQFMPGLAWRPPFFGSINIRYRDGKDVITEQIVDIYGWNRYTIYAYCHLRDRNRRKFSIKNVIAATDVNTGEQISDLLAWLKTHGLKNKSISE